MPKKSDNATAEGDTAQSDLAAVDARHHQMLEQYLSLQLGDLVRVRHEVRVGFRHWTVQTEGTVVGKERRRHGLHYQRNRDDKVYSDVLILRRDDGEQTTVTLDEFSEIKKLPAISPRCDSPHD